MPQSIGDAIVEVSKLVGNSTTDFGNTLADATSTLEGLFDIQLSSGGEQQKVFPKKQKKRGQRL